MKRRELLGSLAAISLVPKAQAQSRPQNQIAVLFPGNLGRRRLELIASGVRSVIPADTPSVEPRSAQGDVQVLRRLAAALVADRVDVILAIGSAAVHAAYAETRSVPIVALDLETDPVGSGLVASFAHPEGNVTGIFFDAPEVAGKWFQLLREIVPHVQRIGLLFDTHTDQAQVRAAEDAALHSDVQTLRLPVDHRDRLPAIIKQAIDQRVEALIVHSSPIFVDDAQQIGLLALEHKLPSVALFPISAATGALIAFGPDNFALLPRAGAMAAKVLKGAKPAELAIERPTVFKLVVNLRTAMALSVDVPASLISIADEVIE